MNIVTAEEQELRDKYFLRMAVANAHLNKMKEREMREFIVSHLMYEYNEDSELFKQDQELYLKEGI